MTTPFSDGDVRKLSRKKRPCILNRRRLCFLAEVHRNQSHRLFKQA